MVLGAVSTVTGPRFVYLVAPVIVIILIVWLIIYSYRTVRGEGLTRRQALDTLFAEAPSA